MSYYSRYVLPKLINWACKGSNSTQQREKVIPLAEGNVLEIGVGSGFNLPFYEKSNIQKLTAIDPSPELWNSSRINLNKLGFTVEFIETSAEKIPVVNNSFDSAVITYTLCTIPHLDIALKEIRRVLVPGAKLIFNEHGIAPDRNLQRWQNQLNPIWKKVSGGCNLNRNIPEILESNGFSIGDLNAKYLSGWKPTSFTYWGWAYRSE